MTRFFSSNNDRYSHDRMAIALAVLFSSAMATAWLGLHVEFGAFAAGIMMPRGAWAESLRTRLEDVTLVLLLPLFFVQTGLRSDISVLYEPRMALTCLAVIGVATAGKFGGTWLGAAIGGVRGTEARALGVLMNTRGLVELVILNIGLEVRLISGSLFTMFVLMALVTTCMTSPLLRLMRQTR
jgi:Kef-type K+ transport system membrane component KefB